VGSLVGIAQAMSGRIYVFAVLLNHREIKRVDTRFWEQAFAELLVEEG
jgi:D-alanyl-D-alanine carboxypeptidase